MSRIARQSAALVAASVLFTSAACTKHDPFADQPGAEYCTTGSACETSGYLAEPRARLYVFLPGAPPQLTQPELDPADAGADSGFGAQVILDDGTAVPNGNGTSALGCVGELGALPCSVGFLGYPALKAMDLRIFKDGKLVAEENVMQEHFNYCGEDSFYIAVTESGDGGVAVTPARAISVCNLRAAAGLQD